MFTPDELPYEDPRNLRRVAIVTGANSGLGYYATLHLYLHGWVVYMFCRSKEKAENAMRRVYGDADGRMRNLPLNAHRGELLFHELNLTELKAVERSVEEFKKKGEETIDLLINNAGVMALPAEKTVDGYDIQIHTNHIGPFLLTRLLLPLIEKADEPRIVFVSSIDHYMATTTVDLSRSYALFPNILWTWARYGNSKTANIHTAKILSLKHPRVLSLSVHPGFSLFTGLLTYWTSLPYVGLGFVLFFQLFNAIFGVSVEELSFAVLRAALSPEFTAQKDNGKYLVTYGFEAEPSSAARNIQLAWKTWIWTENELNKHGFLLNS
jgi:NAD(P)-dependent dehydrogenase (short-subunit alcohol dehydrogenase family)